MSCHQEELGISPKTVEKYDEHILFSRNALLFRLLTATPEPVASILEHIAIVARELRPVFRELFSVTQTRAAVAAKYRAAD